MKPRELDAALAEQLFGWRECRVIDLPGPYELSALGKPDKRVETMVPIPAYSATGDGMLKVLEAMRERGWRFAIDIDDGGGCRVCTGKNNPDDEPCAVLETADTLPRAVALAALEALRYTFLATMPHKGQ